MTTTVVVHTNGNYVATVIQDGKDPVDVGPGSDVQRSFNVPHGTESNFKIVERPALKPKDVQA